MAWETYGKNETPSSKHRAPEKHQAPNINAAAPLLELRCLVLLWCLELGIWSFFMSLLIKGGEIVTGDEHLAE